MCRQGEAPGTQGTNSMITASKASHLGAGRPAAESRPLRRRCRRRLRLQRQWCKLAKGPTASSASWSPCAACSAVGGGWAPAVGGRAADEDPMAEHVARMGDG